METIEQKWNKLIRTVDNRILVASDYLQFIKILNQFRNLALDLQELFKSVGDQSSFIATASLSGNSVFEQHVQEKLKLFEKVYSDLFKKGTHSIELLKNVFINF